MARLSTTVTVAGVVFLLLLEVAIARSLYQNNVAVHDTLPLPESATEPLLRLPSDGAHSFPDPDAKPTDVPESKPISVAVKDDELARDIPDSSPITVRSVPLTSISLHDLRPINRHFPLRTGVRRFPCRRSHHLHSHPFLQPMKRTARISSGDDMMISKADEEGGRDSDSESWARSFRLPYHHFHHHHHHDGGDDSEVEGIPGFVLKHHRFGKEKLRKHWHKKVDDDDDQEDDDEKEKGEERKKKKKKEQKGGLVKRVRKFLDHLF